MDLKTRLLNVLDRAMAPTPQNTVPEPLNMARRDAPPVSVGILATPVDPITGTPKVTHTPPAPPKEGGLENVSAPVQIQIELVGGILRERSAFAIPAADLRELKSLGDKIARLTDAIFKHRPDGARQAWQDAVSEMGRKVAAGEDLSSTDAWSLTDWKEDFRAKSKVFAEKRRAIERERNAIVAKHLAVFAEAVDKLVAEEEAQLQKTFSKYGMPYSLGPWIWMLKKLSAMARSGQPNAMPQCFLK